MMGDYLSNKELSPERRECASCHIPFESPLDAAWTAGPWPEGERLFCSDYCLASNDVLSVKETLSAVRIHSGEP